MSLNLDFDFVYNYPDDPVGITVPIRLARGDLFASTTAKVDTGSVICLFSNELGCILDLKIEEGLHIILDSLGGPLEAYGHEVVIQTLEFSFPSFVYFAKYPGLRRNLLGRQGWLRLLRVGLVDYDSMIYLRSYNQ